MTETDYAPFNGDGRQKVHPICGLYGTNPNSVTLAVARMLIDKFVETGESNHTEQGGTLWVILTWLQVQQIRYTMLAQAGYGYRVMRVLESRNQ